MKPARAVGAGGAPDARMARGASALPAREPVWLARVGVGFAGRVVEELDQPLAGALVVAVAACSMAGARMTSGAAAGETGPALRSGTWFVAGTDADGRFALPVLPPVRYALFALHIGPPPATSEPVIVDGGFLTVPLRLVVPWRSLLL